MEYLNPGVSDHSALLLRCDKNVSRQGRPFKKFNYMAAHKDFFTVVETDRKERDDMPLMLMIWVNLKGVKVHLINLHKRDYGNLHD